MRIASLVGASLVLGSLWMDPVSARTYDHNFLLQNDTDRTIVGAWLSTADDDTWYPISGDRISPGSADRITFPSQNIPCQVQLRVRFSNGETPSWDDGFNICAIDHIRIYWDDDAASYEASYGR